MGFEARSRTTRRQACSLAAVSAIGLSGLISPKLAFAAHVLQPWSADRPTPSLTLNDLDGKTWDLDALKGRPVALNFWASWCEPCRTEMPSLGQLAARHQRAGLVVLAVNYREALPEIKRFTDLRPVGLPILLDRDGDAASAWTPRVFPTTVLVDRSGRPRSSVIGELDWRGPEAALLIEPLLAKSMTP